MSTNAQVRIVVVDDTPPVSSYYKEILEEEGFLDVSEFLDPGEVLRLAEKGELHPDIVVSDFYMGEINGVVLLDSLLKINPLLKSMIVTGLPERVAEVSSRYPIIEKNYQVGIQIINLVNKYAGELESLKIDRF